MSNTSPGQTKSIVIVGGEDIKYGKKRGTRKKQNHSIQHTVEQPIILTKTDKIPENNIKPEQKREIKVELKKRIPKIFSLKPKKRQLQEHRKTKKNKITLGVYSLKKKLTKSNKLKDKINKMPINELRKELIFHGIIKAGSKAPEHILRRIAIDSNLIGTNLL